MVPLDLKNNPLDNGSADAAEGKEAVMWRGAGYWNSLSSVDVILQTKVGASESRGNFEDVLSSAANASTLDTPSNSLSDRSEQPC